MITTVWCFIRWLHPSPKILGDSWDNSHHIHHQYLQKNPSKIHPKSCVIILFPPKKNGHLRSHGIPWNPMESHGIPWDPTPSWAASLATVATGKPPQDGIPVEVAKADRTARLLRAWRRARVGCKKQLPKEIELDKINYHPKSWYNGVVNSARSCHFYLFRGDYIRNWRMELPEKTHTRWCPPSYKLVYELYSL